MTRNTVSAIAHCDSDAQRQPHCSNDCAGNSPQYFIANVVTVLIIDTLELVNIGFRPKAAALYVIMGASPAVESL